MPFRVQEFGHASCVPEDGAAVKSAAAHRKSTAVPDYANVGGLP
jgi:hypothetical protein